MKLSVIIPAYNEKKTIAKIVEKVKTQKLSMMKKEIIVVDDGSTDGTYEELIKIKDIEILRHEVNKGKGSAIRTGLTIVKGDIVIVQDADLELDPADYPALMEPFVKNKASVVYGSRILGNKGAMKLWSYYFGGRVVTFFANLIYGINITDEPIGYKAFRTNLLRSLNLKCERFEFCPEVTAKIALKKIKIYEVPVKYYPRTTHQGKKLRAIDGIEAIWTLIKYRFKKI